VGRQTFTNYKELVLNYHKRAGCGAVPSGSNSTAAQAVLRIRDPVPFFDPGLGSGIRNRFFSGSRIPTPYFLELSDKFLGKKFYNSLKTGPDFFLEHLKNKIIFNFVNLWLQKKV
jgi:hypothetical protein